jgi:hypothetical protein
LGSFTTMPFRSADETDQPALHRSPVAGCHVAHAQTKWDLPAAYPAGNFHSVNLQEFANDVDKASGGKLKITVHANVPRSSRPPKSSEPCKAGRRRSARSC